MLQDARQLREEAVVSADVCIVGAGAAGITLARALLGTPLSVCVLESGGFASEPETLDLYRGAVVGRAYPDLERARSRHFGGSTNCWAGFCRPLDPIDFAERPWVPHSGWPFGREELDPYYVRAHEVLRLGPFDYEPVHWRGDTPAPPDLSAGPLESRVFQFGQGPIRMGVVYRDELQRSPRTLVLLHANASHVQLDEPGGSVAEIRAACLDGRRFSVRARRYVLAAGGIENPRVLLAANDVQKRGIGNEHDLVGRFFMEHPHLRHHATLLGHPSRLFEFYAMRRVQGQLARGVLLPREEWLRREELLGHSVQLRLSERPGNDPLPRAVAAAAAEIDAWPEAPATAGSPPSEEYELIVHVEQAPDPSSRVTLDSERDALGMPRVRLDWRLGDLDWRSARTAYRLVAQAMGLAGRGRLQLRFPEDDWPDDTTGGYHHMGTTRMHRDPKQGVVDARGYVHGVSNLLVAGSSVFPTSGSANPTLTLVALSLRMADHLRQELS